MEKEKCLRNGWEKRQFLALRFCRSRLKGSALKNLAGALHTDGVACTLSVGREVKMEIPDLLQKCSTALRLLNQDGVRGIVREAGRKIVTVTRYRLDAIRVDHAAVLPQCTFAEEQFEIRFA